MTPRFFLLAVLCLTLVFDYGCGIKPRVYAVDRPRVDQATMGNAGYVKNQSKESESIAGRSTRRIYVLEIEKKKQPEAGGQKNSGNAASAQAVTNDESQALTQAQAGEVATSGLGVTASGAKVTEYTVEKDDTLQKISKKVYGSYGKWTKIYDANKDVIKNPNFVKPGTVLKIPQN